MQAIEDRCQQSLELHDRYADIVLTLPMPETDRISLAACSVVLTGEHHASIAFLARHRHFATAHALVRPLMECTLRAFWLCYVAPYPAVRNLIDRPSGADLDKICRYMLRSKQEVLVSIAEAVLSNTQLFHSFTHAGIQQLTRRAVGFTQKEVFALLHIADLFAMLSIALAAEIFNDERLHALREASGPAVVEAALMQYENDETPGWKSKLPPFPDWNDPV